MKRESKSSFNQVMSRISRVVTGIAVIFGLAVTGFGIVFWLADGGQDIGGVVGGVCIFAGLSLAVMAFSELHSK